MVTLVIIRYIYDFVNNTILYLGKQAFKSIIIFNILISKQRCTIIKIIAKKKIQKYGDNNTQTGFIFEKNVWAKNHHAKLAKFQVLESKRSLPTTLKKHI